MALHNAEIDLQTRADAACLRGNGIAVPLKFELLLIDRGGRQKRRFNSLPVPLRRSNKYSVPRANAFDTVYYKAIGSYLYVYGEDYRSLCRHAISECHGRVIRLPEHKKEPANDWISIAERMRDKWNCYDFQHFINGVKKENPRYLKEQLSAIEAFLDDEKADRTTVSAAMKYACKKYRYTFKQFKAVYGLVKSGQLSDNTYEASDVQKQDLKVYADAFRARMAQ